MIDFFEHLRQFDTPTIANALEIIYGMRVTTGFTTRTLIAARPNAGSIIGFARTATIRCSTAFDPAGRREKLMGYYEHLASAPQPTIAVIHDVDSRPGLGAFWGEVNTNIHWGLGCIGAVTNGSMRDLDAMNVNFQCIAASLSPSHAWVHVVDYGGRVDVLGMVVNAGDVVHADRHGAVAFSPALLEKLPAAIELMARREKVLIDAAKARGFGIEELKIAMGEADKVK